MAIIKHWLTEAVKSLKCLTTSRVTSCRAIRKKRKIDHSKLSISEVQAHSVSLFSLAANSYMKRKQWSAIYESILRLADNLRKYASYLDQQNQAFQKRQAMTTCRSDVDDFDVLPATQLSSQHTLLDT